MTLRRVDRGRVSLPDSSQNHSTLMTGFKSLLGVLLVAVPLAVACSPLYPASLRS